MGGHCERCLVGSCENSTCDVGVMIQVFTYSLGSAPIHKEVWPGAGSDLPGCRTGRMRYVDGKSGSEGQVINMSNEIDREQQAQTGCGGHIFRQWNVTLLCG